MKYFATFVIIVLLSSGAWAQEEYEHNRPYTNGSNLRLGEDEEYLPPPPPPKFIHEGRIPDRRAQPRRRRRHEVNHVISKIHHVLDLITEFVNH